MASPCASLRFIVTTVIFGLLRFGSDTLSLPLQFITLPIFEYMQGARQPRQASSAPVSSTSMGVCKIFNLPRATVQVRTGSQVHTRGNLLTGEAEWSRAKFSSAFQTCVAGSIPRSFRDLKCNLRRIYNSLCYWILISLDLKISSTSEHHASTKGISEGGTMSILAR